MDSNPVCIPKICDETTDSDSGQTTLKVFVLGSSESIKADERMRDQQREKNREAAAKCRQRRKEREQQLMTENNRLKTENTILQYQVKQKRRQAEELRNSINNHLATCSVRDVKLQQLVLVNDSMMCGDVDTNEDKLGAGAPKQHHHSHVNAAYVEHGDVTYPDNELQVAPMLSSENQS